MVLDSISNFSHSIIVWIKSLLLCLKRQKPCLALRISTAGKGCTHNRAPPGKGTSGRSCGNFVETFSCHLHCRFQLIGSRSRSFGPSVIQGWASGRAEPDLVHVIVSRVFRHSSPMRGWLCGRLSCQNHSMCQVRTHTSYVLYPTRTTHRVSACLGTADCCVSTAHDGHSSTEPTLCRSIVRMILVERLKLLLNTKGRALGRALL